jgi:uncharacterized protein YceK
MRRLWFVLMMLAIAGCGAIRQESTKLKEENAATEAAVKRMVLEQGDQVPGHPKFTALGSVEGVCGRAPAYDDDSSSVSPGFKHAAYDKYGDKVDAIIKVDSWFVIGNEASAPGEPGNAEGHFQCRGTAVHFEQ